MTLPVLFLREYPAGTFHNESKPGGYTLYAGRLGFMFA